MRELRIVIALLFVAMTTANAQVGNSFPMMEGESLTNEMINIPEDIKGKYSIIGLAYSKKSEDALKTWFEPAYYQFIHQPEKPSLFAGQYDVNVYFVPMFTGAKRPAYKAVMKKVKKSIDPKLLPYVLFYKGELKKYRKELGFKGKDIPYFFVLDGEGKIIYMTAGKYTDSKMREIADQVEDSWN
ncbi:MAG: hypothetical protein WBA74_04875 [Cyclobacteriaceae bacterium]